MKTLKKIKNRFIAYRRYRKTVHELNCLSERELQDMGLVRGDINLVARAAVNRTYEIAG
jgi:uncharacterized protein YjiS (DUF1127 family)